MSTTYAQNLMNNPLFHLSSGSKELFHSNFLYWLSLAHEDLFLDILRMAGVNVDSWGEYSVRREYLHFDLCVVKGKDIILVIENKMKSLPYDSQLEDYEKKSPKAEHMILSLKTFSRPGWISVTYRDLACFMESCAVSLGIDDTYVSDYVRFIKDLTSLTDLWIDSFRDDMPFTSIITSDRDSHYSEAKRLRIHDLYSKLMYSMVRERVKGKINEEDKVCGVYEVDYYRGTPTLTVWVQSPSCKSLVHQIQVQAQQVGESYRTEYKYMDIWNTSDPAYPDESCPGLITAECLCNRSFPDVPLNETKRKGLSHYSYKLPNEEHRFLHKTIPAETTIGELADRIAADMEYLKNLKEP